MLNTLFPSLSSWNILYMSHSLHCRKVFIMPTFSSSSLKGLKIKHRNVNSFLSLQEKTLILPSSFLLNLYPCFALYYFTSFCLCCTPVTLCLKFSFVGLELVRLNSPLPLFTAPRILSGFVHFTAQIVYMSFPALI